jgi:hypothetical protein
MSHLPFHNDTVSLNHLWFESQRNLITTVCIKLGHIDRIGELTKNLLGNPLKIKPMKDPNKPKRPKSGYLFFCDDVRPKLMKKFVKLKQKINLGLIAKELGAQWGKLKEEDKLQYIELSQKDKMRYEIAMDKYNTNH